MDSFTGKEITNLYKQLITSWNNRSAIGMSQLFTEEGELIGFDGSLVIGKDEIFNHLKPIFDNHPTPPYVYKVKNIQLISNDTAILRAIVSMIPKGKSDIDPSLNAHQSLVSVMINGEWKIILFQNTPAQYHGRPELVEEMTSELRAVLKSLSNFQRK